MPPAFEEKGTLVTVVIHTDGAWSKTGHGGLGAVIETPERVGLITGAAFGVTSNQAEILAASVALSEIWRYPSLYLCHGQDTEVIVYSDSQYVVRCAGTYGLIWRLNKWRAPGSREAPANLPLWKWLIPMSTRLRVRWEYVSGHSGIPGNEVADYLAQFGKKLGKSMPVIFAGLPEGPESVCFSHLTSDDCSESGVSELVSIMLETKPKMLRLPDDPLWSE